jgi:transcription-repair coupling factor (superfamily II helicase)
MIPQKRSIFDAEWVPKWGVQNQYSEWGTEREVEKTSFSGITREYLELHYAEWDKLFVPLTEIYRVSKYLWNESVELTRLSGKEWEKTIAKTEEEIEAIAMDILETSAKRSLAKGRSFGKFEHEEKAFQEAFAYEYTKDQMTTIEEIFHDMESEIPMDRLVSGDVGFGKTEVAMNAIYKAVLSGTQVAVISPLLVLADEHYETFIERFSPFWVRVGVMTRMNSDAEVRYTLDGLKNGTIDVVVGTHRLLSDDIVYKKLGLLVIDEEHRFGVSQKEKFKKIKAWVDILSLSATPIPRSLNLALSGLKKISILATPPRKKKPIETIVSRWNTKIIQKSIETELERGWQIIIIHNRIRWMESIKQELEVITQTFHKKPEIVVTHGQMPGEQIEDHIHAFKKREYDILLSTSIIENGVNFLSANTIIILDPEDFGLASLHQLRGRVGRKDGAGYCYLMYRKAELSSDEKERLVTIANNTHLWAGFEIAMRDMEIRGAGDVLGIKQSGKSKDVWLTLYFRMLEEKVSELKEEKKKRVLPKIELEIPYSIPDTFFQSELDKLNFYREVENIESIEELEEVEEEFMKSDLHSLVGWKWKVTCTPLWGESEKIDENSKMGVRGEGTVWAEMKKSESMSKANSERVWLPLETFGTFGYKSTENITWKVHKKSTEERIWKMEENTLQNLFTLLRTRLTLAEYSVTKLSKVGMNYVFDFRDDTEVRIIRNFLERFDTKKDMVLLSAKKIRVETRYWKSGEEFLESLR